MRKVEKLSDGYIIDDDSYFADQMYTTNSMLKQLNEGSTRKLHHYLNTEQKETEAFLIGSAFHCYILEPDEFDSRYVYAPKFDKRTKIGKVSYAEFLETIGDRKPIPEYLEGVFENMSENIYKNRDANKLLQGAKEREKIHFWKDIATGTLCKGKVDAEGDNYIVDIKTTSKKSDLDSFKTFMDTYKVHQQAAFYTSGTQKKNFYFIMCELKAPFGVGIYKMSEESLKAGEVLVDRAIDMYSKWFMEDEVTDYNLSKIVLV